MSSGTLYGLLCGGSPLLLGCSLRLPPLRQGGGFAGNSHISSAPAAPEGLDLISASSSVKWDGDNRLPYPVEQIRTQIPGGTGLAGGRSSHLVLILLFLSQPPTGFPTLETLAPSPHRRGLGHIILFSLPCILFLLSSPPGKLIPWSQVPGPALVPPLTGGVTLSRPPVLSGPPFLHPRNGDNMWKCAVHQHCTMVSVHKMSAFWVFISCLTSNVAFPGGCPVTSI